MRILQSALGLAWSLLGLVACASQPPVVTVHTLSFEEDALDTTPAGFVVAETNGQGHTATWRVTDGLDPHDPGHVVRVDTSNTGQTYNLLLSDHVHDADFHASLYVFALTGFEDQGGGLVWRARDADNYYVARWNPLEDNLRLYTVVDGVRTQLASAEVELRPSVWRRLEVTARGPAISVGLDGTTLIRHDDTTFPDAGRVGFWTKADASTLFDRLEWSTLR